MPPKSGQSEREEEIKKGKLKTKKGKIHKIPWHLKGRAPCFKEKQVLCELISPSGPKRHKGGWIHPYVMLDVYPENDDTTHALSVMHGSTSNNILHASLVLKGVSKDILAWVEPFTDNLEDYFKSNKLGISASKEANAKIVFPTTSLSSAVNQIVDGMGDLQRSGHYHGNFSFANTRYLLDKNSGAISVKLCNFKIKRDGSYAKKLCEDWHAVAKGLDQIRKFAEELEYENLDWCQLDGLIKLMKNVTPCNIDNAFEVIKQHPFLWGMEERKLFFMHDIPLALKTKPHLWKKVENAEFITLPWTKIRLDGFLPLMNSYRFEEKREAYNVNCRVSFVKFVSGVYTHEHKLNTDKKFDKTIRENCPDLSYRLYELLPHANSVPLPIKGKYFIGPKVAC